MDAKLDSCIFALRNKFEKKLPVAQLPSFPHFRVRLNGSWFVFHDKVLNFHDWILCNHESSAQDKTIKPMGLPMDLGHLNNIKVILTLWTLNSGDRVPLFYWLFWILLTMDSTNLKKSYSRLSEKHDQSSINLTNIVLNFIG